VVRGKISNKKLNNFESNLAKVNIHHGPYESVNEALWTHSIAIIRNHVFMWTAIVLRFLAQQFDLAGRNRIYLAGFTISACLVECFTLRHILRMVVNMLNDDGPLGEQADLGHQAQASADQAHMTWPLAPPGAPMPTDFVAGQAPAEAGIGQSQGNTPFQTFSDLEVVFQLATAMLVSSMAQAAPYLAQAEMILKGGKQLIQGECHLKPHQFLAITLRSLALRRMQASIRP